MSKTAADAAVSTQCGFTDGEGQIGTALNVSFSVDVLFLV